MKEKRKKEGIQSEQKERKRERENKLCKLNLLFANLEVYDTTYLQTDRVNPNYSYNT